MARIEGVIFDLDGTIADTEDVHRKAFNTAFREFQLEWNWSRELYADLLAVAGGRERIGHYVRVYWPEFTAPDGDLADFVGQLHYAKTRIYQHLIANGEAHVRPGIARLIEELRAAERKIAIATSTARANVHAVMASAFGGDWQAWCPVVVTCTELKAQKPSPVVYRQALKNLQLGPQRVLAIEDTHNGYLAAHQAGLGTIITSHFYTRHHEFPDALLVANHLGEPGQPCTVVRGEEVEYVDLALLERLVGRAHPEALVA